MKLVNHVSIASLFCLMTLGACVSASKRQELAQPVVEKDIYTLKESTDVSSSGCNFEYRHYIPLRPTTHTTIILGHGFLRNQDTLINLSRAFANEGIPIATLNFCNMRLWNGNHVKNAADMRSLAHSLDTIDDVIFAGFSAGALAALLAADEQTQAVLTLDLVDQSGLGLAAAQQLNVPMLGLHGPPHRCNANNNGLDVFAASQDSLHAITTRSELIPNASHCEFESPSNWLCERACGDSASDPVNEHTRQTIMRMAIDQIRPYTTPLQ